MLLVPGAVPYPNLPRLEGAVNCCSTQPAGNRLSTLYITRACAPEDFVDVTERLKPPLTNNTGRATVRGPHQCAAYQPKGGTLFEQLHFLQRAVAKTYGLAPNSVQIQAAVPFEEHAVVVVFRINLWRPVDIQLVEESHPGIAMVRNHTATVIRETDAMSSRRVRQRWQQERKRA